MARTPLAHRPVLENDFGKRQPSCARSAMDFVQMRDGSSYVGEVTSKKFAIDTGFSKPLSISTDRIVWIVFRNENGYPKERMRLKDASELAGSILDKEVAFRSDATGSIKIPVAKILALHLLSSFGEN
jgi:hypothetical protein